MITVRSKPAVAAAFFSSDRAVGRNAASCASSLCRIESALRIG
jgi:hypothetical protein